MIIKFKTKSGAISELEIEELLEIDGRHYNPAGVSPELQQHLAFIEGRLSTIETLLGQPQTEGEQS